MRAMDLTSIANKNTYIGLFLVTLSVLMYEILLTRIFSVVAYYHFAFMAISIAMFGMTIGAMLVYILPSYQRSDKVHEQLAFSSLLFSVTLVQSFLVFIIPLQFSLTVKGIAITMLVYSLLAIPFIFSGICICLVLTKFTHQINKLYAVDLFGASLGCFLIVIVLNTFSASTALFGVGSLAGISAIFFCNNLNNQSFKNTSIIVTILLSLLAIINVNLEKHHIPVFRFSWVKYHHEYQPLYEKWNSFSRLTVTGDPWLWREPFGWGLSDTTPQNLKSRYLWLQIDASAGTPIINYHDNLNEIKYMKYDVTNLAHYLRPDSNVLIIGVGGGHDVLSSFLFHQKSVVGIEINPTIVDLLKNKLADYSGNLNKISNFTLVNDEARSYISRLHSHFDIIQMSLIDTWAATAAGAFALSENSLYTEENWQSLLNHLTPNGILTVTRWYLPKQPAEIYRVATLTHQTLKDMGILHPENNIMIVAAPTKLFVGKEALYPATVLISRTAFTKNEINMIANLVKKMHFILVYAPTITSNPLFTELVTQSDINAISDTLNLDLTPPTDDRPFFFQMIRLSNIFNTKLWNQNNYFSFNSNAVTVLGVLLMTVIILTLLFVLLPLSLTTKKGDLLGSGSLLTYFASIGLGFMFIEVSQIQRLTVFLGHPTYGLSVVLFALLIFTGMGSLLTTNTFNQRHRNILPIVLLLVFLCLYGFFSKYIMLYFQASSTPVRILVAILMLSPMGLCMGTALPLGMQLANNYSARLTPWLWGINGATSICGSVLAISVALAEGISISFWTGVMCYLVAICAYFWITRNNFLKVSYEKF